MGIERADTFYVCDLSGKSAPAIEFADNIEEDDPLEDAPEGWTQVLVRTRVPNPDYARSRQAFAAARANVKKELKDEKDPQVLQAAMFALQQQFLPYLSVPQFLVNEAGMWVAPEYIDELMRRMDPELHAAHTQNKVELLDEEDDDFDELEDELDGVEDEEEPEEVPVPTPPEAKSKSGKKKAAV